MGRIWMTAGALSGAGSVGMAALAAHALAERLDNSTAVIQSAIQIEAWHALALLLCGLWVLRATALSRRLGNVAGVGFALGSLLFCGGIYAHRLAGLDTGPAVPFGGVLLILAWLLLAASAATARLVR